MNKKIITSIILIALLLITGFLFMQKTTQTELEPTEPQQLVSTEGWETCRNEEYEYEFKYPAEWYLYNSEESYIKEYESPLFAKEAKLCQGVRLVVSDTILHDPGEWLNKPERKTLGLDISNQSRLSKTIYAGSTTLDEYFNANPRILETSSIIKKSIIGGEIAVWIDKVSIIDIMFFHNESLFRISHQNLTPQLTETILSTFKFID